MGAEGAPMSVSNLDGATSLPVPGAGARRTKRSRRRAIFIALLVQAVVLVGGLMIFFRVVRAKVAERMREQIAAGNTATAQALTSRISSISTPEIEYLSERWERIQKVVEGLNLPASAFVCVLDGEGKILCHPELRRNPSLRDVNLSNLLVKLDGTGQETKLRDSGQAGIVTGETVFNGIDRHFLATTVIPETGMRLLVHQPLAGLMSAGDVAATEILGLGVATCAIVLLCTGIATTKLMRRHDSELVEINTKLEQEVATRVDQAISFRDAMIFGLAKLADFRDSDTGRHLERIAEYSETLARELSKAIPEVDETFIRRLRVASAMHDIGKVGVEDAVLLKPGKLTSEERLRIERHPVMGADTLIAIRQKLGEDALVEMSIVVALEHHERWDGTGYPLGIAGMQIHLAARIVSLADVYDALTSERVYKRAMTHAEAMELIRRESGKQFDPLLVQAFEGCAPEFERIRRASQ